MWSHAKTPAVRNFLNFFSCYWEVLYDNSPCGLTFMWWGCYGLCLWHKPTELAYSFLFCSCIFFFLYDPFNCISFHKLSQQLSVFSLCSSGLISGLLVLSTVYLFRKVSFSPDIMSSGWLGSKHQITNLLMTTSVTALIVTRHLLWVDGADDCLVTCGMSRLYAGSDFTIKW